MRKEKTLPPTPQPKQWKMPFSGATVKDGLVSEWNGHSPKRFLPLLRQLDILAHHLLDGSGVFDLQELVFRDKSHFQMPVFGFRLFRFSVFGEKLFKSP